MTDREILELAARAAGLTIHDFLPDGAWVYPKGAELDFYGGLPIFKWAPLTCDGEARRLAVELRIATGFDGRFKDLGLCAYATYPTGENCCNSIMQRVDEAGSNKAATRRAITRAAAEIGRALP